MWIVCLSVCSLIILTWDNFRSGFITAWCSYGLVKQISKYASKGKIKFGLKKVFWWPPFFWTLDFATFSIPLINTKNTFAALLSPFSSQCLKGYLGKKREFSGEDLCSGWIWWIIMQCLVPAININSMMVLNLEECFFWTLVYTARVGFGPPDTVLYTSSRASREKQDFLCYSSLICFTTSLDELNLTLEVPPFLHWLEMVSVWVAHCFTTRSIPVH